MKNILSSWLLATIVTAAMIFVPACKDPNETGLGVLPNEDIISGQLVDTFRVELTSRLVDSVNTYRSLETMLGTYIDPQFGTISAATYSQFRIVGTNLQFGADLSKLTLDSIVLSLDLSSVYGRFDDAMQVQIHEITEDFPDDDTDTLWSNYQMGYDQSVDFANGYKINFGGLAGFKDFINIKLDDSLGRKLLFAPVDSLLENNVFTEFFKGLRISTLAADPTLSREPGGIFNIDLLSSNSQLVMYYKDTTSSKTYLFPIGSAAKYYTQIQRSNYSNRMISSILGDTSMPEISQYAAIQSGALIKTYIDIPGLKDFPKAGINRAELILPVPEEFLGSQSRYTPPVQVLIYAADSTGLEPISSTGFNSSATWDPSISSYVIPLTNTVMQILDDRLKGTKFILLPNQRSYSINRAIFGGYGNPNYKPRLKVILTEIPG